MVTSQSQCAAPPAAKRSAAWDSIRLERQRPQVGRSPEHQHVEHLAVVSLGGSCGDELKATGGFSALCCGSTEGAVIVPAGQPHYVSSVRGRSEYVSLFLDPELLLRAAADAGVRGRVEIVAGRAETDLTVRGVALSLISECEQGRVGGRLYAESLANILAIHLLRNYAAPAPSALRFAGGLAGRRLRRVLDYISENYERDVSLGELAAEAGVSPFHFSREFKRATGFAPHQYLINVRVERAKALLAESELPLAEVSLSAGFSSQSHFTRLFHRLTGVTPKSYRDSADKSRRIL
jgi:AraC family transcriptional regulator